MNDTKVKQQIVEKIKNSANILVAVSNSPSVDALSAALGLTLLLNKLDKHATAVFSGAIPPAITFLDPAKTFENSADSLRDFIIALDKEKADHLRYKVEGDVVKIFITPYRTTITSEDLEFSQGDYNVELVLALGVENQNHLDSALQAHGKILHDATVVTMSAGDSTSELGSLDWHEEQASGLSEMVASLTDALRGDKPVLDGSMATAILTGIVASTDRFSNTRTTSRVMTLAAQLMAAGADQQLIAAKLQESHEINSSTPPDATTPESTTTPPEAPASQSGDGGLSINHVEDQTLDQVADSVVSNNQEAAAAEANKVLADKLAADKAAAAATATPPASQTALAEPPLQGGAINWTPGSGAEPSFGGTLNATADQAADDTRRELESDQNKTILTHSYLGDAGSNSYASSVNEANQTPSDGTPVDIFASGPEPAQTMSTTGEKVIAPPVDMVPAVPPAAPPVGLPVQPGPTLADLDKENRVSDNGAAPLSPLDLPPPPPLPDFSTLPPPPIVPAYAPDTTPPTEQPGRLGDIFAPEGGEVTPSQPAQPNKDDPGQFHIPGQ